MKRWFDEFTLGRTRIVDQDRAHKRRTGRSPANVNAIKTLIQGDRTLTLDALVTQSGLPRCTVHRILRKDLQLKRKCMHFVQAQLTPNHWRQCLDASQSMLRMIRRNAGVLKCIITMDETWVYMYDPASRVQSSEWLAKGEARPTLAKRPRAIGKCMLVTFCDWRGMIYYEFVRSRTINTLLFIQILSRFQAALRRTRPCCRRYLHMDNASPHKSRLTCLRLLLTGMRTLTHPPYSPDLMQSDFWLYPCLKKGLKGWRFASLDDLEDTVDQEIAFIPSHEYLDCFTHKWPMRWARCVYRNGDYFEGLS